MAVSSKFYIFFYSCGLLVCRLSSMKKIIVFVLLCCVTSCAALRLPTVQNLYCVFDNFFIVLSRGQRRAGGLSRQY